MSTFPSARLANVLTRRANLKVLKYANKASCSDFDIFDQATDSALPSQLRMGVLDDVEQLVSKWRCTAQSNLSCDKTSQSKRGFGDPAATVKLA
jgi:hypothetical protein